MRSSRERLRVLIYHHDLRKNELLLLYPPRVYENIFSVSRFVKVQQKETTIGQVGICVLPVNYVKFYSYSIFNHRCINIYTFHCFANNKLLATDCIVVFMLQYYRKIIEFDRAWTVNTSFIIAKWPKRNNYTIIY